MTEGDDKAQKETAHRRAQSDTSRTGERLPEEAHESLERSRKQGDSPEALRRRGEDRSNYDRDRSRPDNEPDSTVAGRDEGLEEMIDRERHGSGEFEPAERYGRGDVEPDQEEREPGGE